MKALWIVLAWYVACGLVMTVTALVPGGLVDRETGRRAERPTLAVCLIVFALWPAFFGLWTMGGRRR